jgi:hypothetical protein
MVASSSRIYGQNITTWNVPGDGTNTCTTADPSCSTIQSAINASSSGDTIQVAAGTFFENLTITTNTNLTLKGTGAGSTIIDGSFKTTVITINLGSVSISGVTVQHGSLSTGNGYYHDGGGIYNGGTLTITSSTITNNSSNINGGGIYNNGTLTITNSTIANNFAYDVGGGGPAGGGIYNNGTLTIINSTIASNSAPNGGSGGASRTAAP